MSCMNSVCYEIHVDKSMFWCHEILGTDMQMQHEGSRLSNITKAVGPGWYSTECFSSACKHDIIPNVVDFYPALHPFHKTA